MIRILSSPPAVAERGKALAYSSSWSNLGLEVVPSDVNFLLFSFPRVEWALM